MPKLEWKVLTKKHGSSTSQGIPPGKEDLLWVTGSVTLIYGTWRSGSKSFLVSVWCLLLERTRETKENQGDFKEIS